MSGPQAPSPTRRGRIIAVLVGLLVTGALAVAAVIGVERTLAAKAEHELYEEPISQRAIRLKEHSPGVDRSRRPSQSYLAKAHNLPDIEYRLRTNSQGFIEPSGEPWNSSDRDLLIAFLGGSTTECLYVPEESRFPAVVREYFLKNNVRADVLNGGVSGNNAMHSVNTLVNKVLGQKPDYVVLMHAWNDIGYLLGYGDYWSVDHPLRSLVIEDKMSPDGLDLKAAFKFYLPYTFNLVKTTWQRVRPVSRAQPGGSPAAPKRISQALRARVAEQFEGAITTFVQVSRSWGIVPILMTQAAFLPPRSEIIDRHKYLLWVIKDRRFVYEDRAEMHGHFNDVIRQVANKLDVPVIDLARFLSTQDYIYDPVHLNEKGSRLAGELVFTKVKQLYDGAEGRASSRSSASSVKGADAEAARAGKASQSVAAHSVPAPLRPLEPVPPVRE